MSVQWDRDYRREGKDYSTPVAAFCFAVLGLVALVCLVNEFIPVGR